jgi:hypothetical protein
LLLQIVRFATEGKHGDLKAKENFNSQSRVDLPLQRVSATASEYASVTLQLIDASA